MQTKGRKKQLITDDNFIRLLLQVPTEERVAFLLEIERVAKCYEIVLTDVPAMI